MRSSGGRLYQELELSTEDESLPELDDDASQLAPQVALSFLRAEGGEG